MRPAPHNAAHRRCANWHSAAMSGVVAGCGALFAWSLVNPAGADAFPVAPISPITPIAEPIVKAVATVGHAVLHPVDALVEGFIKLLQAIFGGVEAEAITEVINALLRIPNFDAGRVAALENTSVAIAAGMLSAVLTLSIVRYYVAGLADHGSGGFEALQALSRLAGAVGFIILWPWIFNTVVEIPRLFDSALLGSGSVQASVALLFDAALVLGTAAFTVSGAIGLIFVILIGLLAACTFIALIWMKVLVSVLLMFLYVSTPYAAALWPVPEFSWLFTAAMRTLFVALIVPCVWAILFALSAAINADVLTWVPTHSVISTVIVRPLAGITLMILCVTIPRFLVRTAMIGPHGQSGGGRLWRTVTIGMLGSRVASGAARTVATAATEGNPAAQRMIDALPSPVRPPSGPGQGGLGARMVFGRSGYPSHNGGAADTNGTAGGEPSGENGAASSNGSGKQQAEEALNRKRDSLSVPGITRPDFDWRAVNAAGQNMHAASRLKPPTASDVEQAMGEFPAETQQGLADFYAANPAKLREFAAQHLHSDSLSPRQRDALVTIGSARGEDVEVGMHQARSALRAQETARQTHAAPGADKGSGTSAPAEDMPPGVSAQPSGEPPARAPSMQPPPPSIATQSGDTSPGPVVEQRPSSHPNRDAASQGKPAAPPIPPPQPQPQPPSKGSEAPSTPPNRGLPDDPFEPFRD